MTNHDALQDQIAYYRARASEYDEWFTRQGRYDHGEALNRQWFTEVSLVEQALFALAPVESVLELACGTGIWTQHLVKIGTTVTALDAAPEMIALNRQRLGDAPAVQYQQVDLFAWEPQAQYDLVFFGFWLSHVPPEALDAFMGKVARAVRPGGHFFLVDSLRPDTSSTANDHAPYDGSGWHTRRLNDGREYKVVKVFYDLDTLAQKWAAVGFAASIRATPNYFLYGWGRAG